MVAFSIPRRMNEDRSFEVASSCWLDDVGFLQSKYDGCYVNFVAEILLSFERFAVRYLRLNMLATLTSHALRE